MRLSAIIFVHTIENPTVFHDYLSKAAICSVRGLLLVAFFFYRPNSLECSAYMDDPALCPNNGVMQGSFVPKLRTAKNEIQLYQSNTNLARKCLRALRLRNRHVFKKVNKFAFHALRGRCKCPPKKTAIEV